MAVPPTKSLSFSYAKPAADTNPSPPTLIPKALTQRKLGTPEDEVEDEDELEEVLLEDLPLELEELLLELEELLLELEELLELDEELVAAGWAPQPLSSRAQAPL